MIEPAILANAPVLEGGIHLSWFTTIRQADDQQPTKEDIKITEEWYICRLSGGMIEVDRLMQISLKDHVIIGKGWFSFFERGMNGEA